MRVATAIIVLAAALGAAKLWTSGATSAWVSTGVMVGAGLGVIVVAWGCGSMVAQSTAQAIDGYAGLGALVRRQAEVGQVAFSERPVLVQTV